MFLVGFTIGVSYSHRHLYVTAVWGTDHNVASGITGDE